MRPKVTFTNVLQMRESVVRWLGGDGGHRCGYCKNRSGFHTEGLWAFYLTPTHYQLLIDRGWRRSGKYCYKPVYTRSCCQLYTIRCIVDGFKLTKSMRKSAKLINDFIVFDKRPKKAKGIKFRKHEFAVEPTESNGVWRVDKWIAESSHHLDRLLSLSVSEWVNTPHSLTVLLVRSSPQSPFFQSTFREEHLVYVAYQCAIHGDAPSEVGVKQFSRFLVETPFVDEPVASSKFPGFGAYHVQFRIDNRLVAVSVLDILPYCVSSVYCFYDPAFGFLNLGTFAALYEIAIVRALKKEKSLYSHLDYYYMGYFINTCQKMKYKGQFRPAELVCPESMRWQPIEESLKVIDAANNAYVRLDPDTDAIDADGELAANIVENSSISSSVLPVNAARLLGTVCTELSYA